MESTQDRSAVAQARHRRGRTDGAEGTVLDGAVGGGGGADHRAFRKHTLLPLDDCLQALQATILHLTRSSLHRLFQRHDISRLPRVEDEKPKKRFSDYPLGYVDVDVAEIRTDDGKLHLFVAICRGSKFAFAELHPQATRAVAAEFLSSRNDSDSIPSITCRD